MKGAIVIKVMEDSEELELSIETNVSVSEYTKYYIIRSLMKSLEMNVDWDNPIESTKFVLKMELLQRNSDNTMEVFKVCE